jgi:hypothetical protein
VEEREERRGERSTDEGLVGGRGSIAGEEGEMTR